MSTQRPDDLAAWDDVSAEYAARPQVDWFDGFIERHVGDVGGRRVLDLGCGHGWLTHALHTKGADVVGVDGSERLLEIARSRHPGVAFEHHDLRRGYEGEFDIVVALTVLMDIPDLAPLRSEALVYDGWRRRIPTRVGLAAGPVER